MKDEYNLEEMLKNLKLTKRSFLLNGKDTQKIDLQIKEIENHLKENEEELNTIGK